MKSETITQTTNNSSIQTFCQSLQTESISKPFLFGWFY